MDNIRIICILSNKYKNESECSDIMLQAHEACKQNIKNVIWLKEDDYQSIEFCKTDFVIFEEFAGDAFNKIKETKCARIIGPWCVTVCLMEGKQIPNYPWPIYNVAMFDCIVACSYLPKKLKQEIKDKIELMGGCYSDQMLVSTTHLITDSVQTEKYSYATENGVKVMLPGWVDAIWSASQTANVHCSNDKFSHFKVPPFHNLTICSTGFTKSSERNELTKMISENGGKFTGRLNLSTTDVLVCKGIEGSTSEKYKAARNVTSIKCVTPDWITDSIEKGYALPYNAYQVKKGHSTPTKDNESINPNFSVLSAIIPSGQENRTTLEDTVLGNCTEMNFSKANTNKRKASQQEEFSHLIDNLDIKKAKSAGEYLDGCSVLIAGFDSEQREKLCKILNWSGATRFDDITDRVTHVIVGDIQCHDVKLIKSKGYGCALVNVKWLIESIEKKQPANEEEFLVGMSISDDKHDVNSPLSKKGLKLLKSNRTITEMEAVHEFAAPPPPPAADEPDIMQQYLGTMNTDQEDTLAQLLDNDSKFATGVALKPDDQKSIDAPTSETHPKRSVRSLLSYDDPSKDTSPDPREYENARRKRSVHSLLSYDDPSKDPSPYGLEEEDTSLPCDVFEGLKFIIAGFEKEEASILRNDIENACGEVVGESFEGVADYAVMPVFRWAPIKNEAKKIVTDMWTAECLNEGELRDVDYYHQSYNIQDTTTLANCVITCSGFISYERNFLRILIEAMGGRCQDQLARVTSLEKHVVESTHLISVEASGKKYSAALKWGLPVVTKDWLLECAKTGKFIPENDYLLGDSKAPERSRAPSQLAAIPKRVTEIHNSSPKVESPVNTSQRRPSTVGTPKYGTPANKDFSGVETPQKDQTLMGTPKYNTPSLANQEEPGPSRLSRVLTPINNRLNETEEQNNTPVNKFMNISSEPCSQVTPVHKIMQEVRKTNLLGTDDTPKNSPVTYDNYVNIKTPDTPLERFLTPNPNKGLRKQLQRYINQFPDFAPPEPRRLSTPLSELKKELWHKIGFDSPIQNQEPKQLNFNPIENEPMEVQEEPKPINPIINSKLQLLEDLMSSTPENKRSSRAFQSTVPAEVADAEIKDSQAFTVGWDYRETVTTVEPRKHRIFMISGIDSDMRQSYVEKLEKLGGLVSDLPNYDPNCTHLVCPKPARNEKTLSCMAAGKWILHVSYVDCSVAAGHFLNEEEYEFGNPKSVANLPVQPDKECENRVQSMHYWRKEVALGGTGAFQNMRAIVIAPKRESIVRVIEAGGGIVLNLSPPFDPMLSINATHCFLELRAVGIERLHEYIPLAKQGIYCVNTLFISEYLHRTAKNVIDCILPPLKQYYPKSS